jgi:NDP-sugar pyrophosphorylase family protein
LQEKYLKESIYGVPFEDYFVDIGIPDDLNRAQKELLALNK